MLKVILIIAASITVLMFLTFHLIPYLNKKIGLWYYSKKIKRMAEKQSDPEKKKLLMEISEGLYEVSKEEKL